MDKTDTEENVSILFGGLLTEQANTDSQDIPTAEFPHVPADTADIAAEACASNIFQSLMVISIASNSVDTPDPQETADVFYIIEAPTVYTLAPEPMLLFAGARMDTGAIRSVIG